jgi:hypothetical protein
MSQNQHLIAGKLAVGAAHANDLSFSVNALDGMLLPTGGTLDRPQNESLVAGVFRFNNTTQNIEWYTGAAWVSPKLSTEEPLFQASAAYTVTYAHLQNWNEAYLHQITAGSYSSGTLTLVRNDGSVVSIPGLPAAQVPSDWNATAGPSQILNKPLIPAPYSLPVATGTVLGGIRIGTGLSIDGAGVVSVAAGATYSLPTASSSVLGGVKVGAGLLIDGSGVLSATGAAYSLPVATPTVLGGIKIGTGLSIDGAGVVSLSYSLPTASASVLGGIKIGANLSIDGAGVVSATDTNNFPTALGFAGGTLSLSRQGLTALSVSLDGRYLQSFTETDPIFTASQAFSITATNKSNWSTAYNKVVTGIAVVGSATKTLTLTFQDTTTLSTTFTDLSGTGGDGNTYATALAFASATGVLTLTNNDATTVSANLDGRYLRSETDPIALAKTVTLTAGTGIAVTGGAQALSANPAFSVALNAVLDHLNDVVIATPANNQLLHYNASTAKWENWTPTYLSSFSETDPIFSASVAAGITATNLTNWNQAYNKYPTAATYTGGTLSFTARDGSAAFSVSVPAYALPTASATTLGGVKIGGGLSIDASGVLSTTGSGADGNNYPTSLSFASGTLSLGRSGLTTLTVSLDGRYLQSFTETDPVFTASFVHGITSLGTGLSLVSGVLSAPGLAIPLNQVVVGTGTAMGSSAALTWNATTLALGTATAVATTTPINVNLGGSFSSVAGSNLKLKLYADGTNTWGLGPSSSQLDYVVGAAAAHVFYVGSTAELSISSTAFTVSNLAGTGTRMVVVDAAGTLSTQAIPSGGTADGNNYPTGLSFAAGTLTMTRNGLGNLTVSLDGRYVQNETDPIFTASFVHGITSLGSGLSLTGGVLSATASAYSLPTASASVLGGIKVGGTLSINAATGVLDVKGGTDGMILTMISSVPTWASPTAQHVETTGDVLLSGSTGLAPITATLANSGVTAGTYFFPNVSVDAKGRVTSISAGSVASLGTGQSIWSGLVGTQFQLKSILAGSGIQVSSTTNEVVISALPGAAYQSLQVTTSDTTTHSWDLFTPAPGEVGSIDCTLVGSDGSGHVTRTWVVSYYRHLSDTLTTIYKVQDLSTLSGSSDLNIATTAINTTSSAPTLRLLIVNSTSTLTNWTLTYRVTKAVAAGA